MCKAIFSPSLVEALLKQWLSSISVFLLFVTPRSLLSPLSHISSCYFSSLIASSFFEKAVMEAGGLGNTLGRERVFARGFGKARNLTFSSH